MRTRGRTMVRDDGPKNNICHPNMGLRKTVKGWSNHGTARSEHGQVVVNMRSDSSALMAVCWSAR